MAGIDDDVLRERGEALEAVVHLAGIAAGDVGAATALEDAGVNPSRDDIAEAIKDLGGVDVQYGVPGHITEGKYFTTSVIFPMRYHYPCPHPTTSKAGSCIVPEGDPLPLPERE